MQYKKIQKNKKKKKRKKKKKKTIVCNTKKYEDKP